mmetsp:Transcript_63100/g.181505  ORF Transcript_63100/g.181505 Transcript_63100/m.181505 type:complete len:94 (-) Transcript_63100:58-339(-)
MDRHWSMPAFEVVADIAIQSSGEAVITGDYIFISSDNACCGYRSVRRGTVRLQTDVVPVEAWQQVESSHSEADAVVPVVVGRLVESSDNEGCT